MARKLVEYDFSILKPHPQKNKVTKKVILSKMKWQEKWSKMIFAFFRPPHPKKFKIRVPKKDFVKNEKIKLGQN